jgi:hypothetical protein
MRIIGKISSSLLGFHQKQMHFVSIYPCLLQISAKFIGAKQFLPRHPLSPARAASAGNLSAPRTTKNAIWSWPERVFCTRQKIPSLTLRAAEQGAICTRAALTLSLAG